MLLIGWKVEGLSDHPEKIPVWTNRDLQAKACVRGILHARPASHVLVLAPSNA